jgi:hypothetical protein
MKTRSIIFSAPMVRAILAGQKTQTRRVVKPQPPEILPAYEPKVYWPDRDRHMTCEPGSAAYLQFERPGDYDGQHVMRGGFGFRCPYGQPGDRLWLREAHMDVGACVLYRADHGAEAERAVVAPLQGWASPIHMPRCASRITLEVTGVRVERLQSISEADAQAEGIPQHPINRWFSAPGMNSSGTTARAAYALLWNSIHGPNSWDANPWVWVLEFTQVPTRADQRSMA